MPSEVGTMGAVGVDLLQSVQRSFQIPGASSTFLKAASQVSKLLTFRLTAPEALRLQKSDVSKEGLTACRENCKA